MRTPTVISEDKQKHTVLIVDDNPTNLDILFEYLRRAGFKVLVAEDGENALKRVNYTMPDIILLDVVMPGIDGFETCRLLKADETTRNIPVIFMTALPEIGDEVKGFQVGAVDYISKPIRVETLLVRIETHLALRSLQQSFEKANDELAQRVEEITTLNLISQTMAMITDLRVALEVVAKTMTHLFGGYTTFIALLDSTKSNFTIVGHAPLNGNQTSLVDSTFPLDQANDTTLQIIEKGQSLIFPGSRNSCLSHTFERVLQDFQIHCAMIIPLLTHGQITGIAGITTNHKDREFTPSDVTLAETIAGQIAAAVENTRLINEIKKANEATKAANAALHQANQELQRLATLDGLTHVANRRRFDEYLDQIYRQPPLPKTKISLILGDIDYFKRYNDTYGHQAGDDCLRRIAQAINRAVRRSTDLVARYGGEEFAVVLPNTDTIGAINVAKAIQDQVDALKIGHQQSEVSDYVTISMGIATAIPGSQLSPTTLIASADKALYEAKLQGRNRYIVKSLTTLPI